MGYADYILSGRARIGKMRSIISDVLGKGEEESEMIVRQNLQNHLRNVVELIKYPQLNAQSIGSLVHLDGRGNLDSSLKNGKGVILLTAHFGAKQFSQIVLGLYGYAINQINYHMSEDELTYVQKHISQKNRIEIETMIPTNFISAKSFMRPVITCLKNNEALIIAGDGIGLKKHMDDSYMPVEFLGKKMLFPTNVVSLAKRTGALVVPVFVVRENFKHRIFFETPLNADHEPDNLLVMKYAGLLEKYIRQHPSMWELWEEFDKNVLLVNPPESSSGAQFNTLKPDVRF